MRVSLILGGALAAAAVASTAFAGPVSSVQVSVSPAVQKKLDKTYGQREFAYLQQDLTRAIERSAGVAPNGDRIEVQITDLKPNRPTFKQLGDTVGLSMQSIYIGGATLQGERISADGVRTPVTYKRYDNDIRESAWNGLTTWATAQNAFNGFARRVAQN